MPATKTCTAKPRPAQPFLPLDLCTRPRYPAARVVNPSILDFRTSKFWNLRASNVRFQNFYEIRRIFATFEVRLYVAYCAENELRTSKVDFETNFELRKWISKRTSNFEGGFRNELRTSKAGFRNELRTSKARFRNELRISKARFRNELRTSKAGFKTKFELRLNLKRTSDVIRNDKHSKIN